MGALNRRGFLGVLARAPVVGPIAAKLAGDEAAARLAGLDIKGVGGAPRLPGGNPASTSSMEPTLDQSRLAAKLPWVRDQLRDLYYEQTRLVYAIDPDIAVLKSVSLSAKIVYQRQRIVAERLAQLGHEGPWNRVNALILKAVGVLK